MDRNQGKDRIERDGNISSIEVSIRQRLSHLNFMKSDWIQNLVGKVIKVVEESRDTVSARKLNLLVGELAKVSNLDWPTKESPSKDSSQKWCENSFEERILEVNSEVPLRKTN